MGSDAAVSFPRRVYAIVRRVPRGRVITYGAIASLLGDPRKAREVGWAMAAIPRVGEWSRLPAHRVINARGELSGGPAFGGYDVQRKRLEADGVVFEQDERVDLERYLWLPGAAVREPLRRHPPTGEQARDGDQDDCTEHSDEHTRQIEAKHDVVMRKERPQPAADERTKHAQHDVANESVAAATHDHAG
jgi:methylated-DNA-protein-cysteine methyltransferase-like protein